MNIEAAVSLLNPERSVTKYAVAEQAAGRKVRELVMALPVSDSERARLIVAQEEHWRALLQWQLALRTAEPACVAEPETVT